MRINAEQLISKKLAEKSHAPDWFKSSFTKQIDFIKDPARLKAAHCTRRAGKSYGAGLYLCKEAFETPNCSVLYVALTRESAYRILWKDVLKAINRDLDLGAHFNEQKLIMTFPNGSQIYLLGADSRQDEMDKLLGSKFKLVVIDEAPKYRISMHRLIFDVLKPAVADYEGTIAMIGTACNFTESYFAKVTRGTKDDWAVHRWSAIDNPHMKRQFKAEIDQHRARNPKVDSEAWFRQNYLGEWVVDRKVLIYKHTEDNIIRDLPTLPPGEQYTYNLGLKISYSGYSALSVVAYTRLLPEVFVVEARKLPSADLYNALEEAEKLHGFYDFASIICVDSSKRLAQQIRSRFQLSVEEHSEKDKSSIIKVFRSELERKKIKVLVENADIVNEWDSIIQDERFRKDIREHPLCPNNLATATLYAWNKCHHYSSDTIKISEDPNDDFWNMQEDTLNKIDDEDNFDTW